MVLVRERSHLVESFANSAEYLQDAAAEAETPNFWDYGVELTRPAAHWAASSLTRSRARSGWISISDFRIRCRTNE